MKNEILIKNTTVWTGGEKGKLLKNHSVLISQGKIKKIAPYAKIKEKAAKTLDGKGKLLMPGFINAHMHFYSTLARGLNKIKPSKNFTEILENLWWKLDKKLTKDASYYSALIPLITAVRKGTTTLIDHHASPYHIKGSLFEIEKGVRETGLRSALCYEVSDRDGEEKTKEGIKENLSFIEHAAKINDNRIKALFGLHASFTLSDKTLEQAAAYERNFKCGFHVHCAEAQADQINSETLRNMRVVERFDKFGILGPKTILAHCVHINEREMDLISQSQSAVVHNPQSNANNSVGIADIIKMKEKGILFGLGTDAMTVNMTEELRCGLWLQHLKNDPSKGFAEICQALTVNNAKIANRYFEKIGEIKEGWEADLILIDYIPCTPFETDNFYGHLVFGISQSQVDTTISGGKILMENKKLKLNIDEEKINKKAAEIAKKIWSSF
ncbi:MAG: putative aminohydrolase SsnA [Elusimicrobiota bacterium]